MNRFASPGVLTALVAANAALVFALVAASAPREARAIGGGANYTLSIGQGNGISQEIVYLVDAESGKSIAFAVNAGLKRIDVYGVRDISKDINGKAATPK